MPRRLNDVRKASEFSGVVPSKAATASLKAVTSPLAVAMAASMPATSAMRVSMVDTWSCWRFEMVMGTLLARVKPTRLKSAREGKCILDE